MSDNLYIQETYLNADTNIGYGETDVYETFTNDKGKLFHFLQKEYGGCISRIYVDTIEGRQTIGWVFQKRVKYDDSDETYLREVWVTLHRSPPTKTIEYHYAE